MKQLKFLVLFPAASLVLLCAGCPIPPIGWGGPPRPDPPAGPGSVHGMLSLAAPEVHLLNGSADSAVSGEATPRLSSPFGVFFTTRSAEYPYNLGMLDYQQLQLTKRASGVWGVDYTFSGLPLADYKLALFQHGGGDVDTDYVHLNGPEFSLTEAAPDALQDWQLQGPAGSGRIYGALLIDGNTIDMPIDFMLGGGETNIGPYGGPYYQLGLANVFHGRVFYEVNGITFDSATVALSSYPDEAPYAFIDGQPAQTNILQLSAAQPELRVDLRAKQQRPYDYYATPDQMALAQGSIELDIKVEGATTWDDDVVVEAIGATAGARAFIFPQQLGLGSVIKKTLSTLDPGTYEVTAYRLGETNAVSPEVVGSATVVLPVPAQDYEEDSRGNRYYFTPQPKATAALTVDLS